MENATGKRVLMFCAPFFGYDRRLCRALEAAGYQVDLYDEKPGAGFVDKTCIRYNIGLYRPVIRRYIRSLIAAKAGVRYDYVFVVKGEAVNAEAIGLLRQAWPEAKFLLYLWDSVANIPECERRMKLYDRVLTFDPKDAETYSLPYLPIPYDENAFRFAGTGDYRYDAAFIGTAHSVRPRVVKRIQEICRQQGRSCYVYFYSPHILVYLFNKLTNPNYRHIKRGDVHFKPLTGEQVNEIYASSRCVLDIEHPRQTGATTRPVEMLPMGKKIITTNRAVMNFPFYNENNYCIVDRDSIAITPDFWELPYIPTDPAIVEQYSPRQFVKTVFQEEPEVSHDGN